ncbi:MAG TPA: hypothetical protein VFI44_08915, partial [Ornithinibacter sp.]|nr:hypothetical protein [Ornithinibacter sp.]
MAGADPACARTATLPARPKDAHDHDRHTHDHPPSRGRAGQAQELLASTTAALPQLHVLTGGVTAWGATGAALVRGE